MSTHGLGNTLGWGLSGLLGALVSPSKFFRGIVTLNMSLMPKEQRLKAVCEKQPIPAHGYCLCTMSTQHRSCLCDGYYSKNLEEKSS